MIQEEVIPKLISGVIGLAFREPDVWVIAEYKTDKVDENLDDLIDFLHNHKKILLDK